MPKSHTNHLLTLLPAADYARLSAHLQAVPLPLKQILYKARAPIDYVYFPTSGIVSAMTTLSDGSAIEVATIGKEGMVGLTAFIGGETSPNEMMVQVQGEGLRMPARVLAEEARSDGRLRQLFVRYHTAYQTQVSYGVACNGLHKIEQRCCRWLLMTADRVVPGPLLLTHEFLAIMLGVQRSSVSETLRPLQERGLIQYSRGEITIVDRPGLEALACECYAAIRDEFTRLLG